MKNLGKEISEFVTIWKIEKDDLNLEIETFGKGYNYKINWGDDSENKNVKGNIFHKYQKPGKYEIKISGKFSGLFLNNSESAKKLLEVKHWGNIKWKNFEKSFYGAENLNVSAKDSPNLEKVKSFKNAFKNCINLKGNFKNWNTENIKDFSYCFYNCEKFNEDLSLWNTENSKDFSYMFFGCEKFNSKIGNWNISNVRDLSQMFWRAKKFNGNIENWDIGKVTYAGYALSETESFNQNLENWNIDKMEHSYGIFHQSGLSEENLEKIKISWTKQKDWIGDDLWTQYEEKKN